MADIKERLDGLRIHIQEPEFLEGKGLSCTKLQTKQLYLGNAQSNSWSVARRCSEYSHTASG